MTTKSTYHPGSTYSNPDLIKVIKEPCRQRWVCECMETQPSESSCLFTAALHSGQRTACQENNSLARDSLSEYFFLNWKKDFFVNCNWCTHGWICTHSWATLALTALGVSASGCESCLMCWLAWHTSACSRTWLMRIDNSKQITETTSCFGLASLKRAWPSPALQRREPKGLSSRFKVVQDYLEEYYGCEPVSQCLTVGSWLCCTNQQQN